MVIINFFSIVEPGLINKSVLFIIISIWVINAIVNYIGYRKTVRLDSVCDTAVSIELAANGITLNNGEREKFFNWESVKLETIIHYTFLSLKNERFIMMTAHNFPPEADRSKFMSLAAAYQSAADAQKRYNLTREKPPYWLAILGLIPFIGFLSGIAMILYGTNRTKNTWMVVLGCLSVLITVIFFLKIKTGFTS